MSTHNTSSEKNVQRQFGPKLPEDAPSYIGIILGILIVILILILGGIYIWSERLHKNAVAPEAPLSTRPTAAENNEPESTNAKADVETLGAMSNSDELTAIDADLGSTIITDPEADVTAVEAELGTTTPATAQ